MQVNRTQFFLIGQSSYFNKQNSQRQNGYGISADSRDGNRADSAQDARARRRMLSADRQEESGAASSDGQKTFQAGLQTSIVSDNVSYASKIRAGRTKAKDTSLKLKRLRYNFKSISSQILRSKTSVSARQVAGKARREVVRLKRLRNGEYDEEELQSAILHAQAMERVAKKKMRHLLEEELAKAGGPCLGELEEKDSEDGTEELENSSGAQENAGEGLDPEGSSSGGELSPELTFAELQRSLEQSSVQASETMERMDAMLEKLATSSMGGGSLSSMMDDMWESMRDLLEDMGLEDLSEGLTGAVGRDMDPADLKMMKLKHRLKELKEIAEADSEYLKALFQKLAKESAATSSRGSFAGGGSSSIPTGNGIPAGGSVGGSPAAALPGGSSGGGPVAVPVAAAPVPADMSGGIDISV